MPFDKLRLRSLSDARRYQQRMAITALHKTLGERVQARAALTIEALDLVVAVASGHNDSLGATGEA